MDIKEMLQQSEMVKSATAGAGNSKVSLSIVNSKHNGKRISFSVGLLNKLGDPSTVQFAMHKEEGVLIVGQKLFDDSEECYHFSDSNPQIIYCGSLVTALSDSFQLDYSNRTSMSFSNITFEDHNGNPVAIIKMTK